MSTDGGIDNRVDKGVRILSLDSGGPGTYSQLLIIKEYMVRLANDLGIDEADVYPADFFDLMGGVGFGGLVAILLGHLRMNVDEATEALLDVSLAIFPDEAHHNSDMETNTRQLRDSVENILQTRGIPLDRKMQEKGEGLVGCKVALYAATNADPSHPNVLRTYKSRVPSLNPTIVEAICATMTTPSYFSPIKVGPHRLQKSFIGGPRGAHNPTRELLKEASSIFGKETLLVQIISLGCGRSNISSMEMGTDTAGVSRLVQEMAADCDTVEKELATRFCDMDAYLRLNVDRHMENLLMNEWNNLGSIETYTSAYTETAIVAEALEASLKRLQGSTGTVTLGQINHPSTTKDIQDKSEKHKEDLYSAVKTAGDSAKESHLLERLKPVDSPSYHEDRSCMEGTRTVILDEIVAWATTPFDRKTQLNDSTSNVFWLYGMPGLGKTSVANSLCDRLRRSGDLGGSFFCKHDNMDLREPTRVLPTLIAKLALMWDPFRKLVAKVLLDEPLINPESTRGELLLKPLQLLKKHPPHPLVLVIDALDECGQPSGRASLLRSLTEACAFVDWLRIVVISRPENDIKSFFNAHQIAGRDLAADGSASEDIRLFTERRMALVVSQRNLSPGWPGRECIDKIVERSDGLFIFVETLYRLVNVPESKSLLAQVLDGESQGVNTSLHDLYLTVIKSRICQPTPLFHSILRAIVAVSAHRPLCDKTLAKLLSIGPEVARSWVDELGSLLYRDDSKKGGIHFRHLSILEFLVGSSCPAEFRVDVKLANSELTRYCLRTMKTELHFNICGLETSCLSNTDIPGLNNRVEQRIPDTLQYSCVHWSSHLCYADDPVGAEITGLLDDFFAESQPLYWMEVLSLMGKTPVAISSMRLIKAYFKKFEDHHWHLVEDALRFLLAFFTPISTSTPHIYVSALPFTPMESGIWKHASVSFTETIDVCKGRTESWPAPSSIWLGHTNWVESVAYSPDGQNVVSGSWDNTIRIWDVQTGAAVGKPLRGHTGVILSVAYSPDGRNVVSGSKDNTIRTWDAQTGAAVGQPLTGHTGWVWSVAYSPDGQNIVSGSLDRTIRIWDTQTGAAVGRPLTGHTHGVFSVAYSPAGQNVVSCSHDETIRIWDARTGAAVGQPLIGHTGAVRSVAYSPDGQNVVSGSEDHTIRIWDARTGAAVGQPLKGHIDYVLSVAYSPDGHNVVSGSEDHTVRIWDARAEVAVGQLLTEHTDYVRSVAYSPDGQNVVSGSDDCTIRIWDAQTGASVGKPLMGHTEWVRSVAYSPDGQNIVSSSDDCTIRIWDARTGSAVGQPLTGHTGWVCSVAYSPDGQNLVSGSRDNTIRVWDMQTGAAARQPLTGHTACVWSVAYSPDGQNVVSGSEDNTIRVWDVRTGAAVGDPLTGHIACVWSVAYSPDGQNIVSGSYDNTIRVWDLQTGAMVGQPGHTRGVWGAPYSPYGRNVWGVAYSPDGRNVISGSNDSMIQIWDAQSGAAVGQPLTGHTGVIPSVAYSPDGRNVVSGSKDNTIRIWDTQTGAAVGKLLTGHTGTVWSVAYSPDGQNIVSGSSDHTIRIWDAQTGMDQDHHGSLSLLNDTSSNEMPLTTFSGRAIPLNRLDPDGWVRGEEGLLFWVPEDCHNGLTCPAIMTIPHTGRQRTVRIDFTRFQYGTSWKNICGGIREANSSSGSSF